MTLRNTNLTDVQIEGIDYNDAMDFCDAYVSYAVYEDTLEPLSDEDLDELNSNHSDLVYELVLEHIY
jgi:hypothetical protein